MYNRFHNQDSLVWEKGGGSGSQPAPIVRASPPITTQNLAVKQKARDFKKQQAMRKGVAASVFAGETGGYAGATILQQLGGGR